MFFKKKVSSVLLAFLMLICFSSPGDPLELVDGFKLKSTKKLSAKASVEVTIDEKNPKLDGSVEVGRTFGRYWCKPKDGEKCPRIHLERTS